MLDGSPIAWKSGCLPLVTLSSAESEYVQITLACQEIMYLREILDNLGFKQGATLLYEDNQAAIAICNNPCHRSRTRHIARRYHWIWQLIKDRAVFVEYIPRADIFTKPLGAEVHGGLRARGSALIVCAMHATSHVSNSCLQQVRSRKGHVEVEVLAPRSRGSVSGD
eukprot:3171688-Rhodomonas_salina.1